MGFLKFKVRTEGLSALQRKMQRCADPVAHAVAKRAAADTERYVPMRSGSLKNRTQVFGKYIIYPGPYARVLYFGKVMVNARTGKGPMHFFDKNGNEYIYFPEGTRLVPSSRDLNIRRDSNALAQSHWFEASKRKNLKEWEQTAKEETLRALKR